MRFRFLLCALLPLTSIAGPQVPEPHEVLALDDSMRQFLQEHVAARAASPAGRQSLLIESVFEPGGLDLHYDDSITRTVSETFHAGRGNCLSFTLMYVAMAQTLGLDVTYQEVDEPVWQRRGDTVLRTSHINVLLRLGGRTHVVDFEPGARFAASSVRRVDQSRVLAHYYNNRAMELLLEGELQSALAWGRRATEMDPRFVPAWANLGVALRQAGLESEAEEAYLTALSLDPGHAQSLVNLVGLYERWKDEPRKAGYVLRLREVEMNDPYAVFALGLEQEQSGNLEQAARYYRRAVRLHDAEESFHLALFRVYFRRGHESRAAASLARASELGDAGPGSIYERKFALLGTTQPSPRRASREDRADAGPLMQDAPPFGGFPVIRRH